MCLCLCCQISYSCVDFTSALYCNSPVAKKRRELFANTTKCSLSFMKSSSPSGCFENVSTDRPNSNEISTIKTTCRKVRKVQGGQGCLACPGLLWTLSGTPVRVHCGNFLVVFFFFFPPLSRCTEDGCPHKKFFHTRFLMRMRLTPDCSKMLISTSSGYLLILHDLDLNKSLEVGSYPILRARRTTSSSGKCLCKNL